MKKTLIILLLQFCCILSFARENWTLVENTTVDEVYANGAVIKTRSSDYYYVNSTFPSSKASRGNKVKISRNGQEYKLVFDRTDSAYCILLTEVIETQLSEEFHGADDNTIYKFHNNGIWEQDGSDRISPNHYGYSPLVLLFRNNHEWVMAMRDVRETMTVKRLNSSSNATIFESYIEGDFDGWKGETTVTLGNGETWQQAAYGSSYGSAYKPKVTVYESESDGYMMVIHGMSGRVAVRRK